MDISKELAGLLLDMKEEQGLYKDYVSPEATRIGARIVELLLPRAEEEKVDYAELLYNQIPREYPHQAVWWYSVLCAIDKKPDVLTEFIRFVNEHSECFSANTLHFLFYQLKSLQFRYSELSGIDVDYELGVFFSKTVEEFRRGVGSDLSYIPIEKRNNNLVLVITEQFIAIQHGPTKTALDRCKILKTAMGKEVLLINTAEVLSQCGAIPFYGVTSGSYDPGKLYEKEQSWKGVNIPYFQCTNNMPSIATLRELLGDIRQLAPCRVVSIGGSGILVNLVNDMIPVVTVGLTPSALEYTCTRYQTLGRAVTAEEQALLERLGQPQDSVVEGIFTSSLKPQEEYVTRTQLNIPEDAFVLSVIGARLDDEVTEEFLAMLEDVLEDGMYVVFVGNFSKYQEKMYKHSKLAAQAKCLGFCRDILSRVELCDLNINPTRRGGGTSSVESLYKGIPVVSVDYGDVAINIGKDFCVSDYAEMKDQIRKYYYNRDYYEEMSRKAKERADLLLDSETEFVRIMKEVDKREQEEMT